MCASGVQDEAAIIRKISPTNSTCCMLCAFSSGSACGMHIDSVGSHIYPSQTNPTTVISGHCMSAVQCGHTERGHESAVAGEITVLTSSTTFAGKPDISACFLIASCVRAYTLCSLLSVRHWCHDAALLSTGRWHGSRAIPHWAPHRCSTSDPPRRSCEATSRPRPEFGSGVVDMSNGSRIR